MRFSIITPSLNQGTFLPECLASVRDASREGGVEVEHWVIDGGSNDATLPILQKQTAARWISEPDAGQSDAINKGLTRATGDILSYLCADDFLEPAALGAVASVFASDPSVDVVYGDAFFVESTSLWKRLKTAGPFQWERLCRGNFVFQPATFWRRSVYEQFGGFDVSLRFCMDHEYWLRIGRQTRWHYLAKPLASCRLHADAKTSRYLGLAWEEARVMQARYGIVGKPYWDALWMRTFGHYYYRLKRIGFCAWGHYMKRSSHHA